LQFFVLLLDKNPIMKGVNFLTDDKNNKIAVQIDLRKNKDLWEDFCDYMIYLARKDEKTVSLESVLKKINKSSKKK
jgi:hypothetical protein